MSSSSELRSEEERSDSSFESKDDSTEAEEDIVEMHTSD